jgi:hypothetical protein
VQAKESVNYKSAVTPLTALLLFLAGTHGCAVLALSFDVLSFQG